jgi:hypothetical protein
MAFDEAAFAQWHQAQQQQVADYLRRQGIFDSDITGEWLWIIPHRAMVGRVWPKHGVSPKYWIISGVVPTDHAEAGAARTVREAARYFALKWQLEAARLNEGNSSAPPQVGEAKMDWKAMQENIAARAEWLHDLMQDDRRWMPDGLPLFRMDHEAAAM